MCMFILALSASRTPFFAFRERVLLINVPMAVIKMTATVTVDTICKKSPPQIVSFPPLIYLVRSGSANLAINFACLIGLKNSRIGCSFG